MKPTASRGDNTEGLRPLGVFEHLVSAFWGGTLAVVITYLVSTAYDALDVIWFEEAEVVSITNSTIQLEVKAYKIRDCRYVAHSEVGYIRIKGGAWEESEFQYIDDLTPNSTKPTTRWFRHRLSFGIWEWKAINEHSSNRLLPIIQVQTTVGHDCGNGSNIRTTTLGPFDIRPPNNQSAALTTGTPH